MGDDNISLRLSKSALSHLLSFDEALRQKRGVGVLTPEARVLFTIACAGPAPVGEAMKVAGTSYRGFYSVMQRLERAELVGSAPDENDQRVRKLFLEQDVIDDSDQPNEIGGNSAK